jgi:hypothetical protein
MKLQNQTANALVLSDLLEDTLSQYQSGVKQITFAPNGDANGNDIKDIPNVIVALSKGIQAKLADGGLKIVNNDESLGGNALFGAVAGKGVMAFNGVIRTNRDEAATPTFRIMFGTPVAGDEIVDLQINGFDVAAAADYHLIEHLLTLSGTVVTAVAAAAAVSGNRILTWTGAALTDQAAISIYAKLA